MPYEATVYQVFIASPSDVAAERKIALEVIYEWNVFHSVERGIVLLPVRWETHAVREIGKRPQQAINETLVVPCDILLGIFWTRLGSNTGVAESGTIEEINHFRDAGKPGCLYFSNKRIKPSEMDLAQYARLQKFKSENRDSVLYGDYITEEEFRQKVFYDLLNIVKELHLKRKPVAVTPPLTTNQQMNNLIRNLVSSGSYERTIDMQKVSHIFEEPSPTPSVILIGDPEQARVWLDKGRKELVEKEEIWKRWIVDANIETKEDGTVSFRVDPDLSGGARTGWSD